jgi:hypothetical protein
MNESPLKDYIAYLKELSATELLDELQKLYDLVEQGTILYESATYPTGDLELSVLTEREFVGGREIVGETQEYTDFVALLEAY